MSEKVMKQLISHFVYLFCSENVDFLKAVRIICVCWHKLTFDHPAKENEFNSHSRVSHKNERKNIFFFIWGISLHSYCVWERRLCCRLGSDRQLCERHTCWIPQRRERHRPHVIHLSWKLRNKPASNRVELECVAPILFITIEMLQLLKTRVWQVLWR